MKTIDGLRCPSVGVCIEPLGKRFASAPSIASLGVRIRARTHRKFSRVLREVFEESGN